MEIFKSDSSAFDSFVLDMEKTADNLRPAAKKDDIEGIEKLIADFRMKTEDFFRKDRKLNIGVVGQVKAGKSSFLNTFLFDGREVLPKASTPKTAVLTKMEYSDKNIIHIEYYSPDEWDIIEDNSKIDDDNEIFTSAREIVGMARKSGVDPRGYLERGTEDICFDTYEDLIAHLNDYVGEDGCFTPIVKAVTLYLDNEDFKGISIVDTPGLNDPIASRTMRTKEFMEVCDVVFFLSQSGSFLDKSDWVLLSSQLPRKGVKRLVLIASKYDSGVRDVLRVPEEDDIFGDDENTAHTIPDACRLVERKIKRRARTRIDECVKDLEKRGSDKGIINVIKQCTEPVLISSIACNMARKPVDEYSKEEKNVYSALNKFSDDIRSDLMLLSNIDKVQAIFDEVVSGKEKILEQRSRSFIPDAAGELKSRLEMYREKTSKRISMLESNDREQLLERKDAFENRIGNIKADIAALFGELGSRLEQEKSAALRELRQVSNDYTALKEHSGEKTVTDSYEVSDAKWYNPFSWWRHHTEYVTRTEHYTYCIAADAVEGLNKYAANAANQLEKVFTDAMNYKELKRRLLNVVVDNFDVGSEKYDSSLFRIMVEQAIASMEFPVFRIDISEHMDKISNEFQGEITSADERTRLGVLLANSLSKIFDGLSDKLTDEVRSFKQLMNNMAQQVQDSLLRDITVEFNELLEQCKNKDTEIAGYKQYLQLLDTEIGRMV